MEDSADLREARDVADATSLRHADGEIPSTTRPAVLMRLISMFDRTDPKRKMCAKMLADVLRSARTPTAIRKVFEIPSYEWDASMDCEWTNIRDALGKEPTSNREEALSAEMIRANEKREISADDADALDEAQRGYGVSKERVLDERGGGDRGRQREHEAKDAILEGSALESVEIGRTHVQADARGGYGEKREERHREDDGAEDVRAHRET